MPFAPSRGACRRVMWNSRPRFSSVLSHQLCIPAPVKRFFGISRHVLFPAELIT